MNALRMSSAYLQSAACGFADQLVRELKSIASQSCRTPLPKRPALSHFCLMYRAWFAKPQGANRPRRSCRGARNLRCQLYERGYDPVRMNRRFGQNFPIFALLLCFSSIACSSVPNPSFPLSVDEAKVQLQAMEAAPKPLQRPVVVVGGFMDFTFGAHYFARQIKDVTGADSKQVIVVSLTTCGNFEECRKKVIDAVDEAFPSDDPNWTREVDVVGISMGGLASRYAALPPGGLDVPETDPAAADASEVMLASVVVPMTEPPVQSPTPPAAFEGRALRIHRLFTLATPHQGAILADFPGFMPLHLAMRRNSSFITRLNRAHAVQSFPVIPYTRVPDSHVGSANTAPPGQTPIWMPSRPFEETHVGIMTDPRVAADVARRLRGEEPFAMPVRAPLP